MNNYIKLSEYAKRNSITYRTAWQWYKDGKIKNRIKVTPTGSVFVEYNNDEDNSYGVILYARTSSSQNKVLLEKQVERLKLYAASKGYKIKQIVKEFGSGLNDNRKQLIKILEENKYDKIIVEHKDRLTRFGFNYIQVLTGNRIEVINEAKEKDEDITQDLISIIHCFSARIYGLRRANRLKIKVENDIKEIENFTEKTEDK